MQAYITEDQWSADPVPPQDAWAAFLAARFAKRKDLYEKFAGHEKETVRKELRRIRYLREYFEGHRLSPSDASPLLVSLDKAHAQWRERASSRCKEELHRCEVAIARASGYRRQELNRHRLILQQVQKWSSQQYASLQQSVAPESYIAGLDATDDDVDDNPAESNYGYNGWVIAFKKDQGGVTLDHPGLHGKFPHQKISMQRLLYDKEHTPLKRSPDKTQLRYFHVQANNMKWVEVRMNPGTCRFRSDQADTVKDAIARYYGEDDNPLDSQRGPYHRLVHQPTAAKPPTNTEKLLKRELWHGQERGGGSAYLPPHSRQIRPRCALVPSPPWDTSADVGSAASLPKYSGPTYFHSSSEPHNIVLFMPYLHWEIEKRLVRMTNVIRKTRYANELESAFERVNKRKGTWGSVVDQAKAVATRMDSTVSAFEGWTDDSSSWRPRSPLGSYLWQAAKLFQLIDEAADWRLISEHLCTQSPLHPRRTLEQYYYWTTEDTVHRDRQQVVYRATRMRSDPDAVPRVLMVDQLWLWILDENTILTAFPRRWGRNKPDPSAVHRAIRDHLAAVDSSHIKSIYDLALIIIDQCSKVFFERTKPDLRPEVVDMFGSAISNISEKKTQAYERFGRDVKRMNAQDPLLTAEELLRKSLNIKFEWSVLMEAQNVIAELQIMQDIFTHQITVISDFEKALRALSTEAHDGLKHTLDRAADLILDMKLRRDELADLERRQAGTRAQLRELLDMKQQQAGIIEAKAAIRRADETVVQGRSIVVFTVVTIFFLPLSFFASVFGMNSVEFNTGTLNLSTQFMWMFVLSTIVTGTSLAFAFNAWARAMMVKAFEGAFGYLTRPVRGKSNGASNLSAASPHAIREFMIAKQKEWEGRRNSDYGSSSGALPLHREKEGAAKRSGVMARLWRRKSVVQGI